MLTYKELYKGYRGKVNFNLFCLMAYKMAIKQNELILNNFDFSFYDDKKDSFYFYDLLSVSSNIKVNKIVYYDMQELNDEHFKNFRKHIAKFFAKNKIVEIEALNFEELYKEDFRFLAFASEQEQLNLKELFKEDFRLLEFMKFEDGALIEEHIKNFGKDAYFSLVCASEKRRKSNIYKDILIKYHPFLVESIPFLKEYYLSKNK